MQQHASGIATTRPERPSPVRELQESLMLLALVSSTLTAYVAVGFAAVRLLSGR